MDYTLYDMSTGVVIQTGFGIPPVREGIGVLAGQLYHNSQYVKTDGTVGTYPPKPGDWAVFNRDTGEWEDPRDEAALAAELQRRRETTGMTRTEFLIAAKNFNIISEDDAILAARGEVPPSMAPLFDRLPADQRFEAAITWSAATRVNRMDPFIQLWASILEITDEQLDQLFRVNEERGLVDASAG